MSIQVASDIFINNNEIYQLSGKCYTVILGKHCSEAAFLCEIFYYEV